MERINSEGRYDCLYVNIEASQVDRDDAIVRDHFVGQNLERLYRLVQEYILPLFFPYFIVKNF